MRCIQHFAILVTAALCPLSTATSRITTNAAIQSSPSTGTQPWGLQTLERQTEEALIRSVSIEDTLRVRTTTFAVRRIGPSTVMQQSPQTELDFLETSYGLPKSIR
jgi:hypothetical protein